MFQHKKWLYTARICVSVLLLCFAWTYLPAYAQFLAPTTASSLEHNLFAFWQQHGVLPATVVEAVLIAEGVDSAALVRYNTHITRMYTAMDSTVHRASSTYDKTRAIFSYLHSHVFSLYNGTALLRSTLDSGVYNCTSAMALFYSAAQRYNLPVSLYATPAHVFATLDVPEKTVRVEITDSARGFDFTGNIPDVIHHLLQYNYITPSDIEEQGEETLYASFFTHSNRITPPEFLAISYNNSGVNYWQKRQYRQTAEAFEKAVLLHPESRKYRDAYQSALYLVFQQYEAGKDYDAIEKLMRRSARLMQHDTLFIYYLLGTARNVITHYTTAENGFTKSRALLDTLSHIVPRDSTVEALMSQQQYIIDYNFAVYDYNRGDYEGAYLSCARLVLLDTTQRTSELHAKSAAYFALALANGSNAERGYKLLDSLTSKYHQYPIFSSSYRQVTIDYVLQSGLITRAGTTAEELLTARNLLLNVYTLDSANYYLQQLIAAVHHELGMHHLRAHHYHAATEVLRIGLQYDPDNTMIKESLRLIDSYLHPSDAPPTGKSLPQRKPPPQ